MRTSAEIREGFLSFFESKGHLRQPSASLIPRADDRSTLLTSAGMQPQMPFFLGREQPPGLLTVTVQKCFRTPDIDEVGLDTYHLTFFEMLGNFSFGQYFKEGAVEYATEFIREHLKLDWERVWVSVHAGDPELKLGPDQVAIDLWERIGMPPERIVPLPSSENFWSVGGPGPCGPDSEIYWDWGEETGCGEPDCLPGCTRCERFLEIGNLVFMEYELHADRTLTPLPTQNIDTGWGLERVARVLQDVPSVYDTDGYQLIMQWIAGQSGVAYGDSPDATKAHRVLADHGRGMTFLVGDGVTPSNEGRGYVLRRVIRRAVQHGLRIGMQAPFLTGLADTVIEQMGDAYPELVEHRREIHETLAAEEQRFAETLERGMALFEEAASDGHISGDDAFTLQATYGFPIELTRELARERGLEINEEDYTRLMEQHREISRAGVPGGNAQRAADFAANAGFRSDFVGYGKTEVLTQIGALEQLDGDLFLVKLRESPFYPAGGGQVADPGRHREGRRLARRAAGGVPLRKRPGAALRRLRLRGRRSGARVGSPAGPLPDGGEPYGDASAAQGAAGRARRSRPPGGVGGAARQAPLRLHASSGAHARAARGGRAAREREDLREPARAHVRDAARGGTQPRRDDALRREVRRRRARRRGTRVLARAVRRDPRSLDCGDRRLHDPLRRFGRLGRAPDRGADERRGVRVAARARARVGEPARRSWSACARRRAGLARRPRPTSRSSRRRETSSSSRRRLLKGGDLRDFSDRLRKQEKADGAIVASVDDGRAYLVVNLAESLVGRGLDATQLVRELGKHIGGGGGGRPTLAEAGGKNPAGVDDALAAGRKAVAAALSA